MQVTNDTNGVNLPIEKQPNTSQIKFRGGNTLIVNKVSGDIVIRDSQHVLQLVIQVKEEGLVINLNASQLNINTTDEINLSSKRINIEASGKINIKTDGNLVKEVGKDCLTEVKGTNKSIAQIHKITANLGNVEIKANDDVRLDGERVKLNCD